MLVHSLQDTSWTVHYYKVGFPPYFPSSSSGTCPQRAWFSHANPTGTSLSFRTHSDQPQPQPRTKMAGYIDSKYQLLLNTAHSQPIVSTPLRLKCLQQHALHRKIYLKNVFLFLLLKCGFYLKIHVCIVSSTLHKISQWC
jgi:hypothetical protein